MTTESTPDSNGYPAPRRENNDPIVSLSGVKIGFRRAGEEPLTIVTGLDLDVLPGRVAVIAGRSGSGKTSILRVAAGLAPPMAGDVRWNGDAIADATSDQLARRRRALIGMMEQNPYLLPELNALENALIPAVPDRRTRELRDRARDLLQRLGLDKRLNHRPATLSGGEKQRVGLARALLLHPPVIIADEPTASLDRRWADTVIEQLDQAAQHGTAVLVASHDPHLTERGTIAATLD